MQLVKALGDHQTLLFSATIPPAIEKMSQTIMNDPVFVAVGSVSSIIQSHVIMKEINEIILAKHTNKCSEADHVVGGEQNEEKEVI